MTEQLQEILNRKPSKWGNLTVKEFERDIKLLQERVEELERELEAVDRQDEQWKELIRTAMTWKNIYEKESKRFKQALEEIRSEASSYMGNSAAQRLYNTADKALEREG